MADTNQDKAQEIVQQRNVSRDWMRDSYWDEWTEVYKFYKCISDPRLDSDGKEDPDKTAMAMPDTFALVNRRTARITANIPEIGFISNNKDEMVEKSVGRKIMWDWDNGKVQRQQKKHVRQAEMFGWSVRAWSWEVNEFTRRRGLDVRNPMAIPEEDLKLISQTFKVDPMRLADPSQRPQVIAALIASSARRGLLDVHYNYRAYEGPRAEVLFPGDCFPEPYFEDLQTSNYFIIERRRNREWIERTMERFKELAPGFQELLEKHPNGSEYGATSSTGRGLYFRDHLRDAIGMPNNGDAQGRTGNTRGTQMWTILERWTPGRKSKVAFVGEESIFIGEMNNPYILDGKIPFTELILIDDILGGVGDSVARITRGLAQMHNVATNRRFDLYRAITQPIMGTSDRALYDNPKLLRRDLGRLVMMRNGPGSLWEVGNPQAMAAMAQSMGEEAAQQRMFQLASGDSNMSMAANVDPSQMRTATGAKMMQANQDVLTKDLVDMFHLSSVACDVEMMYLLNRSEMADAVEIDPVKYNRNYDPNVDPSKLPWIKSENLHFQVDGKLTVKLGSTLADDDEANVAKAMNLFGSLAQNPLVNQQQLIQDLLIAHGKGPQIQSYIQPQQPGPPPLKGSVSVSVDLEKLDLATQKVILQQAGIDPAAVDQMQQQVEQQAQQQMMPEIPPMEAPPMDAPPPVDPSNILAAGGPQ